jgi:hypothetical protein
MSHKWTADCTRLVRVPGDPDTWTPQHLNTSTPCQSVIADFYYVVDSSVYDINAMSDSIPCD